MQTRDDSRGRRVDFQRINEAAAQRGAAVMQGLFPNGYISGREWVFQSPRRPAHAFGSCKANIDTGKGGDFARGDVWGDFVGAAAYASGLPQREAALRLAESLGVDPFEGGRR